MAFKTKEEMFGDGAGFGTQVPISFVNPSGYATGNRGTGFGEQLTSAVSNRAHYALALNDEDLNDRIADFETTGLDSAYRLGLTLTPGGGRTINKDGGAVEAITALATQYGDDPHNAAFRVNMDNDVLAGGVGFDAVGGEAKPSAGFVDRSPVDISDDTIISGGGQACTLNPGGAGGDQIRLDGGGQWKSGADTNLARTFDIVEVTGAGSFNGVYVLDTFVSDTVATFVRLDGTPPVFTPDTGGTARLYKRKFASAQVGFGTLLGSLFMGEPGDTAALMLLSGQSDATDTASGSTYALLATYRDTDGLVYIGSFIDRSGRIKTTLPRSIIDASELDQWGQYGHFVDKRVSGGPGYESGFIFQQVVGMDHGYSHVGLIPLDAASAPDPCAFNHTASPDVIDCVGASSATALQRTVGKGTTFVEIITPASEAGWYYISDKIAATKEIELRRLDGSVPAFPGAGAGTCRFFGGVAMGKRSLSGLDTPVGTFAVSSAWRGALTIQGPNDGSSDTGGILINLTAQTGGSSKEGIRVYQSGFGPAGDHEDQLLFAQNNDGEVYAAGDFFTDGEYRYNDLGGRVKEILLPLHAGRDRKNAAASNSYYSLVTGAPAFELRSLIASTGVIWPLSAYLPSGAEITRVRVKIRPSIAAVRAGAQRMEIRITEQDAVMGVSAAEPTGALLHSTFDPGTTAAGTPVIVSTGAISIFVNATDDEETNLEIISGNTTLDGILGIEVQYNDPGPRNLGE